MGFGGIGGNALNGSRMGSGGVMWVSEGQEVDKLELYVVVKLG